MIFHGFYILNTKPLIVSFLGGYPSFGGFIYQNKKFSYQPLPKWFRPKHVLEHVPSWCGKTRKIIQYKIQATLHSIEGRTLHLIVNATDEEEIRKRFQVRGAHFNHNIYINENLYRILNEPKIYDAIYTAQFVQCKRHWLAQKIERLMVVSYGGDLHAYCPELKHADFNKEFLSKSELCRKYNQSYAGLCLSAVEGTMLSSTEYLFCGIPIVSTPSKGGRDEFFTPENSIITPPEPGAIAEAVEYWKQSPPDPQGIREQILEQINHLRLGYCAYIAQIIYEEGGGKKDPEELMKKLFLVPDGIYSRYVSFKDLHKFSFEDFNTAFSV